MVFDSHSVTSPSISTGTIAFGFNARNSGVSVLRYPLPQSSRVNATPISAHVQSTLRTLIEDALPRMRTMGTLYPGRPGPASRGDERSLSWKREFDTARGEWGCLHLVTSGRTGPISMTRTLAMTLTDPS